MKIINLFFPLFLLFIFGACDKKNTNISLRKGMVISKTVTVLVDTFRIDGNTDEPAIVIKGNNIVIDFQGAVLKGSNDKNLPDEYYGIGILVEGNNIEIKNLNLQGYYVGIFATLTDNLNINNCKINYNFRCKNVTKNKINKCSKPLESKFGKIRAAGLTINKSQKISLENNKITHNNTGVILESGVTGKIYNNKVTFNLNAGIVDMGNIDITLMHNYINWNKGPGISCSSKSRNIVAAYNSLEQNLSNSFWKNINFSNDLFPQKIKNRNIDSLQKIYPTVSDHQNTDLPLLPYKGPTYLLDSDYGFYDFEYQTIWLREINDDKYTFAIFGPEGNWKIIDGIGFSQSSRQSGSIPATIVLTKAKNANPNNLALKLEFIGVEFRDQFGNLNARGKSTKFQFNNHLTL